MSTDSNGSQPGAVPRSAVAAYLLAEEVRAAHRGRQHAVASRKLDELCELLVVLGQRELDAASATIARVLASETASSEVTDGR